MDKSEINNQAEKYFQKIKHYCAYSERSHYEVKEKLYSFGLYKIKVEELMARLIEENFLNEERYAKAFARGKFNQNKWGKIKIEYELKQKRVSSYNIKIGLKEIDAEEYKKVLQRSATEKWKALKNEQYINCQAKTTRYLLQKGFENDLVQQAVKNLREAQSKK